jgi:hypothetical protein
MSKLEELGIGEEEQIETPEEIPEEKEGRQPLVQPGVFTIKLPDDMSNVWGVFDSKKGKRIYASFNKENALTIYKDTKYEGYFDGWAVNLLINNLEYPRGAERIEVADMTYLVKALEAKQDKKSPLNTNKAFAEALSAHAGGLFVAELTWNAYCNPNKDIYMNIRDEEGKVLKAEVQEGNVGCGSSYNSYSRDPAKAIPIDGETGFFLERFEETDVHGEEYGCPAVLFANARLGRFKWTDGE